MSDVICYRFYVLGRRGEFAQGVDLHCEDDEAALLYAESIVTAYGVEVWQANRFVGRIEPGQPILRPAVAN